MTLIDMASLPVQLPAAPDNPAARRARFFNSGNAFNIKLPDVPAGDFSAVAAAALAPGARGLFACDQSAAMGCAFPATTPLMLARYAAIPAGEDLVLDLRASAWLAYVIRGGGTAQAGPESFSWGPGDIWVLPGGSPVRLSAITDAVLWLVSNEPMLAFEHLCCNGSPLLPVLYPAAEIERQLEILAGAFGNADTSGQAVIFSSAGLEAWRNVSPSMTLSLNTLPPRQHQRAHRHNSAAITLILQGEDCHSMLAGQAAAWRVHTTMVTPPGLPHSHHNGGSVQARFLIVQDGGLHYHSRTMGFAWVGS